MLVTTNLSMKSSSVWLVPLRNRGSRSSLLDLGRLLHPHPIGAALQRADAMSWRYSTVTDHPHDYNDPHELLGPSMFASPSLVWPMLLQVCLEVR